MNYQKHHTLLVLNQHFPPVGFKGSIFFIVDFPYNVETEQVDMVISQPSFGGLGVGAGFSSFVLSRQTIEEKFDIDSKTYEEYQQELTTKYFQQNLE